MNRPRTLDVVDPVHHRGPTRLLGLSSFYLDLPLTLDVGHAAPVVHVHWLRLGCGHALYSSREFDLLWTRAARDWATTRCVQEFCGLARATIGFGQFDPDLLVFTDTSIHVGGHCEGYRVLLVHIFRLKLSISFPASGVLEEANLDIIPRDSLAEDDQLLSTFSGRCVARHVHDLQLLLCLGIKDWLGADWRDNPGELSRGVWVFKEGLEAEPNCVQVNVARAVRMLEALPERIHPDGLALLQRLLNVSFPLALDPQVLELDGHVRAADMLSADSLLASVSPNLRPKELSKPAWQ